jgi:hypothetical protein
LIDKLFSLKKILSDFSDRTGVIYGKNILSFRAIFNDVRNSIDRVHQQVKKLFFLIILYLYINIG